MENSNKSVKTKGEKGNIRQVFKCPDCDADLQETIGHQNKTSVVDCTKCGFHAVLMWEDSLKYQQPTRVFFGSLS